MTRRIVIVILICLFRAAAWPLVGDYDDNGEVETGDLAVFCENWLSSTPTIADPNTDMDASGTVNLADFAMLAACWRQGHVNQPPVAGEVHAACYAQESAILTLDASDLEGDTLTVTFTGQPEQGLLVPSGELTYTYYAKPGAAGADGFGYQVSDGEFYSEVADVNVMVSSRPIDNVVMQARSEVTIPDNEAINVDDSFTLSFWFRTRWPEGAVLAKRAESGGAGVVVLVENSRLVANLYDPNNVCYTLSSGFSVDTGDWIFAALTYRALGDLQYNGDPSYTAYLHVQSDDGSGEYYQTIPAVDFTNPANLVLGRYRDVCYYGAIDSFSNYSSGQDSFLIACIAIEGREGQTHAFSPTYYRRFLVNEGEGHVIYDVAEEVEGTLHGGGTIRWTHENGRLDQRYRRRRRLRGVDGARVLPGYRSRE